MNTIKVFFPLRNSADQLIQMGLATYPAISVIPILPVTMQQQFWIENDLSGAPQFCTFITDTSLPTGGLVAQFAPIGFPPYTVTAIPFRAVQSGCDTIWKPQL